MIHYLRTMGVKKLDFYIATHSHSDHIGSGDEIMNYFPVDRLYIDRYDDSYMLDSHGKDAQDPYYYLQANENYLWDNQYVYDCLIKAANDNNVKIITDLDLDENDNALVVKVNAYGKNALLTSDMLYEISQHEGNTYPQKKHHRNQLIHEHHPEALPMLFYLFLHYCPKEILTMVLFLLLPQHLSALFPYLKEKYSFHLAVQQKEQLSYYLYYPSLKGSLFLFRSGNLLFFY